MAVRAERGEKTVAVCEGALREGDLGFRSEAAQWKVIQATGVLFVSFFSERKKEREGERERERESAITGNMQMCSMTPAVAPANIARPAVKPGMSSN